MSNLVGQYFGKLKVDSFSHYDSKYRYNYWNCICECGKTTKVPTCSLTRKKNPTKSCGCLRKENLIKKHNFNRKGLGNANSNAIFGSYKKSAKKRNIEFKIDYKFFIEITKKECHYCGIEPKQSRNQKETNGEFLYNGIDRVDNNIGYLESNCVPCCKTCNYAKRKMTYDEFYEWIDRINNKRQLTIEESFYTATKKFGW